MKPLIDNIEKLSISEVSGNHTFKIKEVADERMYLKEIPDYRLTKLWQFPYEVVSEREEFKRMVEEIERLSPEKKAQIAKILGNN